MKPIQSVATALSVMSLVALSACGPSTPANESESESATEAASTETPSTPEEAPRRAREDILAEFEGALEAAQETNGEGDPALWTLADEDTTVYLFGTVHMLRPDLEWRTDEIEAAFDSADKLVLEVDLHSEKGQQAVARDFLQRGLFGDGRTLSGQLSESDLEVVSAALEELGLPLAAVEPMEPWMVAVNLSAMALQKEGFDPSAGIEQQLIAEAEEDGKTFGYLETAADQASIFDTLPMDVQKTYLYEASLTLDDTAEMLDLVVEEWADGDVTGLGILVANPDTAGGDGMYDALFLDRNSKWVPQIEAMLDEPGTVFVAVGAGHLAGPDSVVTMLRDKGHTVEGP